MNGVLLWIAGLLVALLGSLFAMPYFIDWNSYRGVFEEEASRILGREVRVGGDVNLRLLPAPYVSFRKVRIADDRASGQAFLRADSFNMWLAVPPLLTGVIEAKQIELRKPALRVEVGPDGSTSLGSFRISRGTLPFVPRDVALQSVRISDGAVLVHGPGGVDLARIDIADAELSASALEGPFRFRGTVNWSGETGDVRGSTAAPEADGSIRFKLTARALGSGNSYTVEGRLADLTGKPRVEGHLTAAFPVTADAEHGRASGPAGKAGAEAAGDQLYELRAQVAAGANEIRLGDIVLTFEQQGQPQLLTGTAEASWRGKPRFRADLGSRWLDLDKAAQKRDASPLQTARRLATRLASLLPASSDIEARFAVDQAGLGGDIVTGIVLALADKGEGLRLQELRAALPGGARIDLAGTIPRPGGEALEGDLLLRGANLARFLAWAAPGSPLGAARGDGSFFVNSKLLLAPGSVRFARATVDVAGSRLAGELDYSWEGRKRLSLTIEAGRANLSDVLPAPLGPELVRTLLKAGSDAARPEAAQPAGIWAALPLLAESDVKLRLLASRLSDGERELRDLDAEILVAGGSLSIPRLTASTAGGLRLDLEGEVRGFASKPKGTLRGVLAAPGVEAVRDGVGLLASDELSRPGRWLETLAPLQLAFVARFGNQRETAVEIVADGTALDGRFGATVLLDGSSESWREAPLEATVAAEGSGAAGLLRQAVAEASGRHAGGAGDRVPGQAENAPGARLLFKTAGTPSRGLAALLEFTSDTLDLSLDGRATVGSDSTLALAGRLEIAAPDAARAMAMAGLGSPAGAERIDVKGGAEIALGQGGLRLDGVRCRIGTATVTGALAIAGSPAARTVEANFRSDLASLPRIAGFVLGGEGRAPSGRVPAERAGPRPWGERAIELAAVEHLSGRVRLAADALEAGDLLVSNASLDIAVAPGRIEVERLEGRALGGAVTSSFKLERAVPSPTISGVFGFWDVPIEKLGSPDAPLGSGKAQFAGQISGQGATPQLILSALQGKGELEFKSARLERLSPAGIDGVAEAFLGGRIEGSREALAKAVRSALMSGPLPIGSRKVPFEIANGAIRLRAASLETAEARVTNETTIDLQELAIDSAWKFEPKPGRARTVGAKGPLPGISAILVGPLAGYGTIEPRIELEAFERELAVRRMERDVENLERLRREDEARARAEAERLRLQQAPAVGGGQVIEAPFTLPGNQPVAPPAPPATGWATPKVTTEPVPSGTGQSVPARPSPAQPQGRDQYGRGDRSGT